MYIDFEGGGGNKNSKYYKSAAQSVVVRSVAEPSVDRRRVSSIVHFVCRRRIREIHSPSI